MLLLISPLLLSIWAWQPGSIPLQWLWQILLSATLLGYYLKVLRAEQPQGIVSLDENGAWLWLEPAASVPWQIDKASRLGPGVIWLRLRSQADEKARWLWIFTDAVDDISFRRLARIVLHGQQPSTEPAA